MAWRAMRKIASRLLIFAGALLLGFWALALLHSKAASTIALAQFPANENSTMAPTLPGDPPVPVDTSLWSQKRIAGYLQSLKITSDPAIAVLRIPRIHLEVPVFRGTDEITLNRGAGWIEGTAAPGTDGNAGIAGHRDGFFRGLKDIAIDDEIEVRTRAGTQKYVVQQLRIVDPSSVGELAATTDSELTLVTCYPFYFVGSAPQRFIVHATAAPQAAAAAAGVRR